MPLPFASRLAALAAILCSAAAPAHASLVLVAPDDVQPAIGAILTLQSPGSSSFEAGSVGRSSGSSADVVVGDIKSGAGKTTTRSLGDLGITSASDLRITLQANEPASAPGLVLEDLRLSIFSPTGTLLFDSGTFSPLTFTDVTVGVGSAGFVFGLDAAQAQQAQSLAFGANFGSNLIGLSARLSGATGGPETFSATRAAAVLAPVPEPGTYALFASGLAALLFVARRRRKTDF